MPFGIIFPQVLFDFTVGKAWLWTLGLSLCLFVVVILEDFREKRSFAVLALIITVAIIFANSWSSHSASLTDYQGWLGNSLHLLAVSVWIGVLLMVGFFARQSINWSAFLRWFTPTAIISVLVIMASGFFMMREIVPEYYNSWMLSYGQVLLIKHLIFIPLIFFAFASGFLVRHRLQKEADYSPESWYRWEGLLALMIFAVSAFMIEQEPPHEVAITLNFTEPSRLFLAFFDGEFFHPTLQLLLSPNLLSMVLIIGALLSLTFIIITFMKKWSVAFAFIFAILFIASAYLATMLAVEGERVEGSSEPIVSLIKHDP
jgi:putative copper resistance protein D